MHDESQSGMGIGAKVRRKEDARHLRGRGQFVADMVLPGMLEMAVFRSPVAHARLLAVDKPEGLVFSHDDLTGVAPLIPPNTPEGARRAAFPLLATEKLRFVGEPVAVALAANRALAEDLAEQVEIRMETLAPVLSPQRAIAQPEVRVHDGWPDNVIQEMALQCGDATLAQACERAPVQVTRTYRTARQSMNPMEGKACLAHWDTRMEQLVLYSSTQVPHMVRDAVCDALQLRRSQLRVVAPDVGGGFGYKCILQAEEVLVCWLAMRLRRPVRWLEDRREHLIAAANAREQSYTVTAFADARGVLLGLKADITVDAGAYSVIPFSNVLDAGMALGNMTGPYRIPFYTGRARAVVTNKPPVAPYRGVGRPGACFAIEQLMDAVARQVGREPWEVRQDNLIRASDMPYTSITGKTYDSGDYPQALSESLLGLGAQAIRQRQRQASGPLRLGVGVAFFVELTGHSPRAAHAWRLPVRASPEPATVRLTGDGGLEIRIGMQSHGQGMETTMAQVAHEVLGVDVAHIAVIHGDTGTSAYSTGTYASRGMVIGAGAVAGACRLLAARLGRLGAALMQCSAEAVQVREGRVWGPQRSLPFGEIARTWHENYGAFGLAGELPAGDDSLEVTYGYAMQNGQGAFTYGAHAVLVEVDTHTGLVRVLDYVVAEDCGVAVNPMIVDGQIIGGVVQGIGTALYEETCYDSAGQPKGATLVDYLLPGAGDVPDIRIHHLVHPSPHTEYGIKGVGEGGAIPSAAAVCSAVNDALREWNVEIAETPVTPQRVLRALMDAPPRAAVLAPASEGEVA
jgi:carbon-monoxide dehydrogenase large subunit